MDHVVLFLQVLIPGLLACLPACLLACLPACLGWLADLLTCLIHGLTASLAGSDCGFYCELLAQTGKGCIIQLLSLLVNDPGGILHKPCLGQKSWWLAFAHTQHHETIHIAAIVLDGMVGLVAVIAVLGAQAAGG